MSATGGFFGTSAAALHAIVGHGAFVIRIGHGPHERAAALAPTAIDREEAKVAK